MAISVQPWGFCCYEEEDVLMFSRLEDASWKKIMLGMDLRGDCRHELLDELLPLRQPPSSLTKDNVFWDTLRSTAILVSLAPDTVLHCRIRPDQQVLAETVLYDIFCNALPRLQMLPFVAGAETQPQNGFRLLLVPYAPASDIEGAYVDFTAEKPTLLMRFHKLNFAQRVVRELLPPLGLNILQSMWNVSSRMVEERLGTAVAAEYNDLVVWLMLRKNLSANAYAITEAEHEQLLNRVKEYEVGA